MSPYRDVNGGRPPLRIAIVGAGAVGTIGGEAVVRAFVRKEPERPIAIRVFDEARITEGHASHEIYTGARAGEGKAEALARKLGALGTNVRAESRHGNVTRWPRAEFEADVALVGLDSEGARFAAQRLLRHARTPAVFAGVADEVAVFAFGACDDQSCYGCLGRSAIALEPSPCVPVGVVTSTRAVASADALRAAAERVRWIVDDLLELPEESAGFVHTFGPGGRETRAVVRLDPECFGPHGEGVEQRAAFEVDGGERLGTAFELAAGAIGAGIGELRAEAVLRLGFRCEGCGAGAAHARAAAGLVRRWPEREQCAACGSEEVRPAAVLAGIGFEEAAAIGLLMRTIAEIGVPPGGEMLLVAERRGVRVTRRTEAPLEAATCATG